MSQYDKKYFLSQQMGKAVKGEVKSHKSGTGSKFEEGEGNSRETLLVDAIDNADAIREWIKQLTESKKKMQNGKMDVTAYLQETGKWAAAEVVRIAVTSASEKTKLAALTEILDRGGNTKVTKIAMATTSVDRNASRAELESLVLGLASKNKDVEIIKEGKEVQSEEEEKKSTDNEV